MAKTKRMRPMVREATPGQSRLFFEVFIFMEEGDWEGKVAPGRMNQERTENGMMTMARM